MEQVVWAVADAKLCSRPLPLSPRWTIPPKRKHIPMTSRRLDRMDPSIEACTTSIWLSFSATMLTCIQLASSFPCRISERAHNQLDRISKSGIKQSAQRLAQLHRDFFGRKRQNGGKRNDGEEVDGKDSGGIPAHLTSNDANRHHDEEEVHIVCETQPCLSAIAYAGRRIVTYCSGESPW